MSELRVGIVGYGTAGRGIHAPLLQAAEGLRVTTVVTGDPARAAVARDELDAQVVPTLDDLLGRADGLDLVVVASPTAAHVPNAMAVVEAGVAVVVDKPLGLSAEQARPLVERAREAAVPLGVFQNRRLDGEHATLRRLLGEGVLGEVLRYEARYERWRPQPKDRWKERLPTGEGGGLLLDLQSHLVDSALDLFGPVHAVYAEIEARTTTADDVTFLVLHHDSGVRSHLGATALAGAMGPRTRVLGTAGAYVVGAVDDEPVPYDGWLDAPGARGWLARGEERTPVRREPAGWDRFYPAVAAALRGQASLPATGEQGLAVLEVLDAAQRSAVTGDAVRLR